MIVKKSCVEKLISEK